MKRDVSHGCLGTYCSTDKRCVILQMVCDTIRDMWYGTLYERIIYVILQRNTCDIAHDTYDIANDTCDIANGTCDIANGTCDIANGFEWLLPSHIFCRSLSPLDALICVMLQAISANVLCCSTLQHTATHCNTLQLTPKEYVLQAISANVMCDIANHMCTWHVGYCWIFVQMNFSDGFTVFSALAGYVMPTPALSFRQNAGAVRGRVACALHGWYIHIYIYAYTHIYIYTYIYLMYVYKKTYVHIHVRIWIYIFRSLAYSALSRCASL